MRNVMKGLLLLGIIVAIASCAPPEPAPEQENEIIINGITYPISEAIIWYWGTERYVSLYFHDGLTASYIDLIFVNQDSEIPAGSWTTWDQDLDNISLTYLGTYYHFASTTDTAVDLAISGTDGGTLTVDGSVSDSTAPSFDCEFHFSGPYAYQPD